MCKAKAPVVFESSEDTSLLSVYALKKYTVLFSPPPLKAWNRYIHSPLDSWGWVDAHQPETPKNQLSPTPAGKRSEFCFLIESLALSHAAYGLRNSDPPSHYKDT